MANFTVTNTNDSGAGSLRQAILDANAAVGADTISFDSSLSGETIGLTSGELGIEDDLEVSGDLDGDGVADITIDAAGSSRVINIDDGSPISSATVTLSGLIISGGFIDGDGGGSGVFNSEIAIINSSVISGNEASDTYGVGVRNEGVLIIDNSTIEDNSIVANSRGGSYGTGAGISNSGDLTVSNSTINDNQNGFNSFRYGSSVDNFGNLKIFNTTISGEFGGDGLSNEGTLDVVSSLVLGGIDNTFLGGANNNEGSFRLSNSIIGNVATNRAIQTAGTNFVANGAVPGALTLDPRLGPLQNNGGSTETQALRDDSPAIDLGVNGELPEDINDLDGDGDTSEPIPFDQRGEGFNRIENGTVDVGPFEAQGSSTTTPPTTSPSLIVDTLVDENDFDLSAGDVSLREAIAFVEDGGTITFDASLSGGTILLNSSLIVSKSLTIEGLGADQLTIDNEQRFPSDRIFLIDDGDDSLNQEVAISGLTVTGGSAGGYLRNGEGSGIANRETLTISSSHITGNGTLFSNGGGIFNYAEGILTIADSTISENGVDYSGGGIYNLGDLTVSNSTVSGNDAGFTNGEGLGLLNGENATATIINSTFRNSSAYKTDIVNAGTLQLISSIVSDIGGGDITAQNSLIENGSLADIDTDLGGNIFGESAGFDPTGLTDNGGSTPTLALTEDSPAIGAGLNPNGLTFDQRGEGFDREIGTTDIGAFESSFESPGPSPEGTIELGLFNADTDTLITLLEDGAVVLASEIAGLNVNIAASIPNSSPLSGEVESVFLDLNDGAVTRTENSEPYALFGDVSGDFFAGSLPTGTNSLSLDLFSEDRRQGDLLETIERTFTIADDLTGLDIGVFDADTDERIATLFDGAELDASQLAGREVSIAAFVANDGPFAGQVESIFLNLNSGAVTRTENVEPYALFGDVRGNFSGGTLPTGENTISFDLYSENRRRGDLIDTVSIDFTIA